MLTTHDQVIVNSDHRLGMDRDPVPPMNIKVAGIVGCSSPKAYTFVGFC